VLSDFNLDVPRHITTSVTCIILYGFRIIQGDQKVSVHLAITVQNNPHTIDELKMAITEYIQNVDRAILNTVIKNTVRPVNKCPETGGEHSEHYL
jgi:hypothetical protein